VGAGRCPAAICATISVPMAALVSSMLVPIAGLGVIVTGGSTVPRVMVWLLVVGVGGPWYCSPASVMSGHVSPVLPTVEYSESMSSSELAVTAEK
jgi:hypothetical protein